MFAHLNMTESESETQTGRQTKSESFLPVKAASVFQGEILKKTEAVQSTALAVASQPPSWKWNISGSIFTGLHLFIYRFVHGIIFQFIHLFYYRITFFLSFIYIPSYSQYLMFPVFPSVGSY